MIAFEAVSAGYAGSEGSIRLVLSDLDLRIADGEYVAVMGRSGSGKTTLARLCNGLVLPRHGRIVIDGDVISASDFSAIGAIRRRVGMVFQNPENQIVSATIEREIAFGLENLGLPRDEMHRRVDRALQDFDLAGYRHRIPHQLSGGEKQRLALAAVMAMQPQHLVLDEPTALLDIEHRRQLLAVLRQLNRDGAGCTVIHITHDPVEALFAQRLIVLHDASVALDGPPRVLFQQAEELARVGLVPPVEFAALARLGDARRDGLSLDDLLLAPLL